MRTYEYQQVCPGDLVNLEKPDAISVLNSLGADGWLLVYVRKHGDGIAGETWTMVRKVVDPTIRKVLEEEDD